LRHPIITSLTVRLKTVAIQAHNNRMNIARRYGHVAKRQIESADKVRDARPSQGMPDSPSGRQAKVKTLESAVDPAAPKKKAGGRPRLEDVNKTKEAQKPWLSLGMSRATWYRRQKEKADR
jgi:hypothetical protein